MCTMSGEIPEGEFEAIYCWEMAARTVTTFVLFETSYVDQFFLCFVGEGNDRLTTLSNSSVRGKIKITTLHSR